MVSNPYQNGAAHPVDVVRYIGGQAVSQHRRDKPGVARRSRRSFGEIDKMVGYPRGGTWSDHRARLAAEELADPGSVDVGCHVLDGVGGEPERERAAEHCDATHPGGCTGGERDGDSAADRASRDMNGVDSKRVEDREGVVGVVLDAVRSDVGGPPAG